MKSLLSSDFRGGSRSARIFFLREGENGRKHALLKRGQGAIVI